MNIKIIKLFISVTIALAMLQMPACAADVSLKGFSDCILDFVLNAILGHVEETKVSCLGPSPSLIYAGEKPNGDGNSKFLVILNYNLPQVQRGEHLKKATFDGQLYISNRLVEIKAPWPEEISQHEPRNIELMRVSPETRAEAQHILQATSASGNLPCLQVNRRKSSWSTCFTPDYKSSKEVQMGVTSTLLTLYIKPEIGSDFYQSERSAVLSPSENWLSPELAAKKFANMSLCIKGNLHCEIKRDWKRGKMLVADDTIDTPFYSQLDLEEAVRDRNTYPELVDFVSRRPKPSDDSILK